MAKYVRDRLGRFKKRINSAYEAGYDSVVNGPDTENCNFAWFLNKASKEEWEHGRTAAQELASPELKKG